MRKKLVLFIALPLLLLVISSTCYNNSQPFALLFGAASLGSPNSTTPIKHIVVIFQENHSFDNYFETFPGVNSSYVANPSTCLSYDLNNPNGGCEMLYNADANNNQTFANQVEEAVCKLPPSIAVKCDPGNALPHDWNSSQASYNGGKMNGFVSYTKQDNKSYQDVMAYFNGTSIPAHWDFASQFALDANFFSGDLSYSYPNHIIPIAAQAGTNPNLWKTDGDVYFNLTYGNIFNELSNRGVTWGYYSGNWNDSLQCQNLVNVKGYGNGQNETNTGSYYLGDELYWNVLPDFPSIQDNPATCHNVMNLSDFFNNINSGYLPQVAWISPNITVSEHPGTQSKFVQSEEYVTSIINDIENSAYWNSTAIFWTYDEYGGWYDNIAPPEGHQYQLDGPNTGYGFRVPLIVISPWVKRGIFYGSPYGQQQDFTALLKTIEKNWGLAPLSSRDKADGTLWYMFNFNRTPSQWLKPLYTKYGVQLVYPVSKCIKNRLCSRTSHFAAPAASNQGRIAPNYAYPLANAQGDPYD
jgi:phospholipase C